jgi:hypothetical protein
MKFLVVLLVLAMSLSMLHTAHGNHNANVLCLQFPFETVMTFYETQIDEISWNFLEFYEHQVDEMS